MTTKLEGKGRDTLAEYRSDSGEQIKVISDYKRVIKKIERGN